MQKEILINKNLISRNTKPFVIAEIGSNYNQNLETANSLIKIAKECGANAVKFQLFNADSLYPNDKKMNKIFKSIELNPLWVKKLVKTANNLQIEILFSCFDFYSFNYLKKFKLHVHKIASSEIVKLDFLHHVAMEKKPVIISTGMCDLIDVERAVDIFLKAGNNKIILLQCSSIYPTNYKKANLNVLNKFANIYECPLGFSDHTLDDIAAITSVGIGATVFEKHITLNKKDTGPDHFYAMEPDEFKIYISSLNSAFSCLGSSTKKILDEEKKGGRRKGIYFSRALKKGHKLTNKDIKLHPPAIHLRDIYLDVIIGTNLKFDVDKNEPVKIEFLKFGQK